jgi:O-antigen/teichoic acid export membrane protein
VLSPYAQDAVISFRSCEVLMNLSRESFYTLLFQISGFACTIIAGVIIARTLGPSNRGIITMSLLYPMLFSTLFNLTTGAVIVHHLGKREYDPKAFAGTALSLSIVMSIIAMTVFFITIGPLKGTFYKSIEIKYLITAGLSVPFYLILYFFSSVLQSSMDIKRYNVANQLPAFSNLLVILLFVVLWRFTAFEAVVAGISGIVLGGFYSLIKVMKRIRGFSFNRYLTGIIVKDSLKVHLGSIATFSWMQANFLILNYYATPSVVGFYSAAFSIANILFFFSISLEIVLFPKVAHATMEEAVMLIKAATRQILLITLSAASLIAFFSKEIVLIYGGKAFLPSITPLILLLPGVVIFVIHRILSILWVRRGWFLRLTLISISIAILSLILNFMLIPKLGATGAAIATTFTYCISSLIGLILFWKYVKKDFSGLFIPTHQDLIVYKDFFQHLFRVMSTTK